MSEGGLWGNSRGTRCTEGLRDESGVGRGVMTEIWKCPAVLFLFLFLSVSTFSILFLSVSTFSIPSFCFYVFYSVSTFSIPSFCFYVFYSVSFCFYVFYSLSFQYGLQIQYNTIIQYNSLSFFVEIFLFLFGYSEVMASISCI